MSGEKGTKGRTRNGNGVVGADEAAALAREALEIRERTGASDEQLSAAIGWSGSTTARLRRGVPPVQQRARRLLRAFVLANRRARDLAAISFVWGRS